MIISLLVIDLFENIHLLIIDRTFHAKEIQYAVKNVVLAQFLIGLQLPGVVV